MRPGVSWSVLGYPGVSWGNQTDPSFCLHFLLFPSLYYAELSLVSQKALSLFQADVL